MPELTEDELADQITAAIEKEQRAIAGDQFFREGLMATAQKVQAGVYDAFIYEVGAELYEKFKKENPLHKRKKKEKGKEKDAA
jgi:hypothetical protein